MFFLARHGAKRLHTWFWGVVVLLVAKDNIISPTLQAKLLSRQWKPIHQRLEKAYHILCFLQALDPKTVQIELNKQKKQKKRKNQAWKKSERELTCDFLFCIILPYRFTHVADYAQSGQASMTFIAGTQREAGAIKPGDFGAVPVVKPSKLMDMSSVPWMLNHVCVQCMCFKV